MSTIAIVKGMQIHDQGDKLVVKYSTEICGKEQTITQMPMTS